MKNAAIDNVLADTFSKQATANAMRLSNIKSYADALPLLADFFEQQNLPHQLHLSPELLQSWPAVTGICVTSGTTSGEHPVCVNRAWAGVADTGTLVLLSGADNPTRLNFLAEFHLVFLNADRIVATKDSIWQRLQDSAVLPRSINFISGPSRTADIEQTIQLGAHGPRLLWVFLERG